MEEGARKLLLREEFKTIQPSIIKTMGTSGGAVDVAAFLSGEPECMVDYRFDEAPQKFVNFYIGISASWTVTAHTLLKRGAVIYTMIRAMEILGYSMSLKICCRFESYCHSKAFYSVQVKKAGEYLDPSVVAFWMTSPAVLRRLFFRLAEDSSEEERREMGFRRGS